MGRKKIRHYNSDSPLMQVPESTIRRMSIYYRLIESLVEKGVDQISSDEIGTLQGFTSAQIRKDFSFFGSFGRRGFGYNTKELKKKIAAILGLDHVWRVAVIGAGSIGSALIQYPEFSAHGFDICLVLDNNPAKIGKTIGSLTIKDIAGLEDEFAREGIDIAIIAIPAKFAQLVTDQLITTSIRGILNFAPCQLIIPPHLVMRQENMALELEVLTYFIRNKNRNVIE
jgi:redox-sensing transcriptional repressor